jgi:hypothetical protein
MESDSIVGNVINNNKPESSIFKQPIVLIVGGVVILIVIGILISLKRKKAAECIYTEMMVEWAFKYDAVPKEDLEKIKNCRIMEDFFKVVNDIPNCRSAKLMQKIYNDIAVMRDGDALKEMIEMLEKYKVSAFQWKNSFGWGKGDRHLWRSYDRIFAKEIEKEEKHGHNHTYDHNHDHENEQDKKTTSKTEKNSKSKDDVKEFIPRKFKNFKGKKDN